MHIFYVPQATRGAVILSEEESKHCVRVLRLMPGNNVLVSDGKGMLFNAVLMDAHPKRAVLELHESKKGYDHWPYHLHIAIAPTKNIERLEWFLEKATEIGIDEISLFSSYHSERRVVKTERLEKVIIAAMKQSLKSRLPVLNGVMSFEQFITQDLKGQKFIAYIDENIKDLLSLSYSPFSDSVILIGPEGDFSPEEVQLAIDKGFKPISLGLARLRTETAALVACQTIQLISQIQSK